MVGTVDPQQEGPGCESTIRLWPLQVEEFTESPTSCRAIWLYCIFKFEVHC